MPMRNNSKIRFELGWICRNFAKGFEAMKAGNSGKLILDWREIFGGDKYLEKCNTSKYMNLEELTDKFTPIVSKISLESNGIRFHLFSPEAINCFADEDRILGRYWYCINVLEKCRLSSITGLLRSYKWLEGINKSYEKPNYMVFCGSLRGFLLSAADNKYSLSRLPSSIANNNEQISEYLLKFKEENKVFSFHSMDVFEDIVEHFLGARDRRYIANGNLNLIAKSDKEYVKILQDGDSGDICDLYSELCEITHPASASLFGYIRQNLKDNSDESGTFLNSESDKELILNLCQKYSSVFKKIFESAFNPSLFTIGLLNLMNIDELKTLSLSTQDLNYSNKWKDYSEKIKKSFS